MISLAEEISPDEGGTVETPDGNLQIIVEPDDLSTDTTISITQTIPQDPQVDLMVGTNPGLGRAIAVYDLEPDDITFAKPLTLVVEVDVTGLNQNQIDRLNLYVFDDLGEILGTSIEAGEDPLYNDLEFNLIQGNRIRIKENTSFMFNVEYYLPFESHVSLNWFQESIQIDLS